MYNKTNVTNISASRRCRGEEAEVDRAAAAAALR
jgi:hypothetical protein